MTMYERVRTQLSRWEVLRWTFLAEGLLLLGAWGWAYAVLKDIEQPLIIHFSELQGINQIGGVGQVGIAASLGIVAIGVNFFLARELAARDVFLNRMLAAGTAFFAGLIFVAIVTIIRVN
ncbi:MAG: hypothetical protein HY436_00640 [Candidatus Liptonbacteria bacterium]|nr:hypothetical protein [Candidatus Liptonbacteria bacterium]